MLRVATVGRVMLRSLVGARSTGFGFKEGYGGGRSWEERNRKGLGCGGVRKGGGRGG